MAKKNNMIPMPTGGSVVPKLLGTAVVLALLVVVVKHPADAAGWVKALVGAGSSAVDGIAAFFHQVAS